VGALAGLGAAVTAAGAGLIGAARRKEDEEETEDSEERAD
jgi:hypothetical protein